MKMNNSFDHLMKNTNEFLKFVMVTKGMIWKVINDFELNAHGIPNQIIRW